MKTLKTLACSIVLLFAVLTIPALASAATIELKSGMLVHGSIQRIEKGIVHVKTKFGVLRIKQSTIKTIRNVPSKKSYNAPSKKNRNVPSKKSHNAPSKSPDAGTSSGLPPIQERQDADLRKKSVMKVYREKVAFKRRLITVGALAFGVSYGISVLSGVLGVLGGNPLAWQSFVPIVGPGVQTLLLFGAANAATKAANSGASPVHVVAGIAWLLAWGSLLVTVTQFVGAISLTVGLVLPKPKRPKAVSWQITPYVTPQSTGFALSGRF